MPTTPHDGSPTKDVESRPTAIAHPPAPVAAPVAAPANPAAAALSLASMALVLWVGYSVLFGGRSTAKDWTGTFTQVQNLQYTIMGNEKRAQVQYVLRLTRTSLEWTVTNMASGHVTVSCVGDFQPPPNGTTAVIQTRVECSGDGAFFEPRNKTLVYSGASDAWTVNSRHLMTDIDVTVVRK